LRDAVPNCGDKNYSAIDCSASVKAISVLFFQLALV
jgi:hypothetical protein